MELRKDPITRSWVIVGHPPQERPPADPCPLCEANCGPATATGRAHSQVLFETPAGPNWQVRVVPSVRPLYRIEGDTERAADGIYDRMALVGADEIVIESPDHGRSLADMADAEIVRVMDAWAARITDLKRDGRFKYITVFKNKGLLAGEDWTHSYSQVTATTFVPRRILYELRAAREWFRDRERCVFCDILRQEERTAKRVVDSQGDYVAFCPYASRVPYEFWIMPRPHNHQFEAPLPGANRGNLAAMLGRMLRRLRQVSQDYHLVVHTSPNEGQNKGELADYWRTISSDYHWHIEVLPIVQSRSKSYSIKEVYFNGLLPEAAAERLRLIDGGAKRP
jgi:UDPglucose--hexose-1-phosphate uridylyltransferase